MLKLLTSIFTWWGGATIGASYHINRRGTLIGTDEQGNRYYEARDASDSYDARKRRWVIYKGYAEASKVPPEWHGWLRYTFEHPPTIDPLMRRNWEKDHLPNLTGTVHAWRPQGAIANGGERAAAASDYQAWKPE